MGEAREGVEDDLLKIGNYFQNMSVQLGNALFLRKQWSTKLLSIYP